MKIETSLKGNYYSCFDESRGYAIHKSYIIKNKTKNVLTYTRFKILIFILLFTITMFFNSICFCGKSILMISCLLNFITYVYIIAFIASVLSSYQFRKRRGFNNTITIDKNGITDESLYGIKLTFKWEKVKAVIIGKYTVTILTDTPVYFYFDIKHKKEIIEQVEKYSNKDIIIK